MPPMPPGPPPWPPAASFSIRAWTSRTRRVSLRPRPARRRGVRPEDRLAQGDPRLVRHRQVHYPRSGHAAIHRRGRRVEAVLRDLRPQLRLFARLLTVTLATTPKSQPTQVA